MEDKTPHEKLGNGCLADYFPHEYPCKCDICEAIWQDLLAEYRRLNYHCPQCGIEIK